MSSLAELERQYRLLAEITADVRYCYELRSDGAMVRSWIAGDFPCLEQALPYETASEGCWLGIAHPDDRHLVEGRLERLRRGERSIDEFRVILPQQDVRWMRLFGVPEHDPDGHRVVRILGAAQDVTAWRAALDEARRNEKQLSLITEGLSVLIAHTGPDERYRQVNEGYERWFGLPREQILGRTIRELLGEPAYERVRPHIEQVRHGRIARLENMLRLPDGRTRSVMMTLVPGDASNPAEGFYTLATDVSELKDAQHLQSLLMAELDHRVKNILAVVHAMVKLSAGARDADSDFAARLVGRIHALALAHDLLARAGWRGVDLGELVQEAVRPFVNADGRVTIHGEHVMIAARAVGSFAIICHELAANAVRYGALSDSSGRIDVRWRRADPDRDDGRLEFAWVERTDRPAEPPAQRGFGTLLIERAAAYELGGEARLEFDPAGLRYQLSVPLAETVAAGDAAPPSE